MSSPVIVQNDQVKILLPAQENITVRVNDGPITSTGGGGGTVTNVSFTDANGVEGVITNPTTTPNLTISLTDITPDSIVASGTIEGSNLSGNNTGDQTITLSSDVTGTGTGAIVATIANDAVTYAKMQNVSAADKLLGRGNAGSGDVQEITVGSGLTMTGTTLSATSGGGGTVTDFIFTDANGVNGTVSTSTTTPTLEIALDDITPNSVAAVGTVTGSNLSGTNTGDQTITLSSDVTGTGTTGITTTIANNAVTYAKMQDVSAGSKVLGRGDSGSGDPQELTLGSGLSITGTTLNATGTGGTVTTVSVTTASGVSGSVVNPTTTPAITIALGAISPTSVAASGTVTGSNLSGTNTGDQTITLSSDVTGSGTSGIVATIANDAVTYAKMQNVSAAARLLGRGSASGAGDVQEITLGSGMSMSGTTLSSSGAISIGGSVTSGTQGSVLFVGVGSTIAQDNNHFFWDDSNDRLTVGSGATGATGSSTVNVTSSTGGETAITLEYKPGGAGSTADAVVMRLALKSSTTANRDAGAIVGQWSTAADATRTSFLTVQTAYNGGSNADRVGFRYTTDTATTTSVSAEVTNSGLAIVPNGSGALMTAIPDGTSTGGNARGNLAIDLQLSRGSAADVASGSAAVAIGKANEASSGSSVAIGELNTVQTNDYGVAIGYSNLSSGTGGVSLGVNNTATGPRSLSTGTQSVGRVYGQHAHASGRFSADGDAQTSKLVWRGQTTNNTLTEVFLDGASAQFVLQNNQTIAFEGIVVARQTNGAANAFYQVKGLVHRDANAASTTVDIATVTPVYEDDAGWDVTFVADTTNGALVPKVTGNTGDNINWGITLRTMEVIG